MFYAFFVKNKNKTNIFFYAYRHIFRKLNSDSKFCAFHSERECNGIIKKWISFNGKVFYENACFARFLTLVFRIGKK